MYPQIEHNLFASHPTSILIPIPISGGKKKRKSTHSHTPEHLHPLPKVRRKNLGMWMKIFKFNQLVKGAGEP